VRARPHTGSQPDGFISSEEIDRHAERFNQYAILTKLTIATRIQPSASCFNVFPQQASPPGSRGYVREPS
jgi:hypothetical protein